MTSDKLEDGMSDTILSEESEEDLHHQFKNHNQVKFCGINVNKCIFHGLSLAAIYVLLLVVGGAVFHFIEHPHEVRYHEETVEKYEFEVKQIINILNSHNYTGVEGDTWELYHKLQENSMGFQKRPDFQNTWGFAKSVIFSFTLITTIGYGIDCPQRMAGQLFLVLYSLIGIPIAGMLLYFFAERTIFIFTWLSTVGRDKVEKSFLYFDKDNSGELEEDEFREAVKMLGFDLNPIDFKKLWSEIDLDGGGSIDLEEFRKAIEVMNADVTESAGQKNKVFITMAGIFVWFAFGVLVFSLVEHWSALESFYFVFVSLTTIGLGDVTPQTKAGSAFLVFFGMIGLGLVAVLITLLQMTISSVGMKKIRAAKRKKELILKEKQLKHIPIFASMTRHIRKTFLDKMIILEFGPNANIVKEGNKIDMIHVLIRGSVTVSKANQEDHQVVSAPSFLLQSTATSYGSKSNLAEVTVHANDQAEVLSLSRADWEAILKLNDTRMRAEV